ncbi:MAG: primosomal protein N' [Pantoea sp. Brub]|nr:primosomal protein N' [Pantoea sp. Brub]
MFIVRVALPIPLFNLFDYRILQGMQPAVGGRVRVYFRNRKMIGIVVSLKKDSKIPEKKLKIIEEVLDNTSIYSNKLWKVLHWAANYYHVPLGEVLINAIPNLLRQGKSININSIISWKITQKGSVVNLASFKQAPKQQTALTILRQQPIFHYQIKNLGITSSIMKSLCKKGLCCLNEDKLIKSNWCNYFSIKNSHIVLNHDQKIAVDSIFKKSSNYVAWLLFGITGSGKTEVYLKIIEKMIFFNRQSLILVPEIGLTIQTIDYFRQRFNVPIDILHSSLNNQEKLAVWLRAKRGETAIIIGTRSALFIPLARPGVIIIDEEHDSSYKQQDGWRYQARDLAVLRAYEENIPIIMGSATPALESLHNVYIGKYHQLNLIKRASKNTLVFKQIINLRSTQLIGGLATQLIDKISEHLYANNQVLLFLNRRGFSPILLCHDCGWIAECKKCEHYYTLYQNQQQLRCHYCNTQKSLYSECPNCNSITLIPIGVGTEQIEKKLSTLFPNIPISRIDYDTTRNKGAFKKYLNFVNKGGAHILIGTQMITKGYNFLDVTLVIIIDVDSSLFSTDFRASEKFAQLYTQVAGRAGRAGKTSEVLLQTYHPNHPILKTLINEGYLSFAKQMLLDRKYGSLPPWTNHALFRAEDFNNYKVIMFLTKIHNIIKSKCLNDKSIWFIGPIPSLQPKKNGRWRWQLIIQHNSRKKLQLLLNKTLPLINALPEARKIHLILDIDPIDN